MSPDETSIATCERSLRSPLCRAAEVLATFGRFARFRSVAALLAERDIERRLTCCWVLALCLVAVGAVAATTTTVRLAEEGRDHGAVVNDAGSQIARAQRIAAFLPELAREDPVEAELARLEILRIADRMEAVFRGLTTGERPPARGTEALRAHYFEGPLALAPRLTRFLAELRAVLDDAEQGTPVEPRIAALRGEALGPMLVLLDTAAILHQRHVLQHLDRLVFIALLIGTATLLLLAAIGMGIFRPMARGIGSLVRDLSRLAHEDPLTGAFNRRAVVAALAQAIAAGRTIATIAIDLDHFKEANERAGHAGGDALLKAASARLRALVRKNDIVGRIGGDEFVVFLLGVSREEELRPIVERIRAALHEPVPLDGRLLPLGATLGVALCPDDAEDPETLLRLADEALLRAKRERRGSIGRATREDALGLEIARELRAMLEQRSDEQLPEGLGAVLQPVVALAAGPASPLLGFEALARWVHPRLGAIPPNRLFAAAGDRATVVRLGRLVRRAALASFAAVRAGAPSGLRLALNLSPAEVFDETLVDTLLGDLEWARVTIREICLEITEEVLLDRVSAESLAKLARLREDGVRLALDDFGTGTSGLSHLLRLPIDLVKIDRRFVQELGRDRKAVEIVRATLALARSLGLQVIGEGVETEDQARTLAELGCDAAQGFFFGRPMGLVELRCWLEERAGRSPGEPDVRGRPIRLGLAAAG